MLLPNGIGAAQMLQKGPSLLQAMFLTRGKASPSKMQVPGLPLAMGENLCAG